MYSLRKNFVEERGLEFGFLEHTLYILVAWKWSQRVLHNCLSWRSMNNANNGMIWAKIYKSTYWLYTLELNYCHSKMWFLFLVCLKRKKKLALWEWQHNFIVTDLSSNLCASVCSITVFMCFLLLFWDRILSSKVAIKVTIKQKMPCSSQESQNVRMTCNSHFRSCSTQGVTLQMCTIILSLCCAGSWTELPMWGKHYINWAISLPLVSVSTTDLWHR